MLHSIEPFVSARQDNDDMEQQEKGNPGMDSSGEGYRPPSLPDQIGLDLWMDGWEREFDYIFWLAPFECRSYTILSR